MGKPIQQLYEENKFPFKAIIVNNDSWWYRYHNKEYITFYDRDGEWFYFKERRDYDKGNQFCAENTDLLWEIVPDDPPKQGTLQEFLAEGIKPPYTVLNEYNKMLEVISFDEIRSKFMVFSTNSGSIHDWHGDLQKFTLLRGEE